MKRILCTVAVAAAMCSAATANSAQGQSEPMDAQTAELLDLIDGDDVEQVSFDSASTLEFSGGELQSAGQKAIGKGCGSGSCCGPVWVGGVEMLVLRPHVQGQRYQGSIAEIEGNRVDSRTYALNQMGFSPRIWLGKQGPRWGLLTRFWYLNQSNMVADPYNGAANGDYRTFTAGNQLKAYTIDLEVNRRLNYRCWLMNLGVGVRHASLAYGTMASQGIFSDPTVAPGVDFLSSAYTKSNINATGLTVGLNGRRLLSPSHNLSMFWGLRGSFLLGKSSYSGFANGSVSDYVNDEFASGAAANYARSNQNLFIGEVQLGVLWQQRLSCLPANVFVKLAAEYQYWGSDRSVPLWNGANVSTGGGGGGNWFTYPQFDSSTPSVNFFGLNLGIGLTWGGCCGCYGKK